MLMTSLLFFLCSAFAAKSTTDVASTDGQTLHVTKKGRGYYKFEIVGATPGDSLKCGGWSAYNSPGEPLRNRAAVALALQAAASRAQTGDNAAVLLPHNTTALASDPKHLELLIILNICSIEVAAYQDVVTLSLATVMKQNGRQVFFAPATAAELASWLQDAAPAAAPAVLPKTHAGAPLRCRDGSLSPSCVCGGSQVGCCSSHGGVAGCSK